jgi:hypothetical protein
VTEKLPVDALSEGSSVIRWLMTEGRHITDAKSFLECFAACLRDARVDVSRITTGVPVLHPQLFSVSSLWERDKGVTERRYRVDPRQDAILANSAIRSAFGLGEICPRRLAGAGHVEDAKQYGRRALAAMASSAAARLRAEVGLPRWSRRPRPRRASR